MTRNSFIVRIYEQPEKDTKKNEAETMKGIVEDAGSGVKHAFHNKEELWKILADHQYGMVE